MSDLQAASENLLTLEAVEQNLTAPPEGGEIHGTGGSQFRIIARTFITNKLAVFGLVIVIGLILFSFVGPLLYHSNQTLPNLIEVHEGPGAGHPIGTDANGYDILGRLMLGGRITMEVAFGVAFFTIVVGVLWGAVAGFFGGIADTAMMRFVDILLAIPALYFYIDLSKVIRTTEWTLILLLSLLLWLGPSRLVRGEVLTLRSREYVQAVTVMGGRPSRIILRHLVPNAIGTIVVQTTFLIADAIFFLTILQYLGLGLQPTVPTWGNMLDDGTNYMGAGYWWMLYPVLILIVLAILAFSFIGDALRDSLDVRLQER